MSESSILGQVPEAYLEKRKYFCLEEKIHNRVFVVVDTDSADEFLLRRGIDNNKQVIEIITPSGKVYCLGSYDDESSAKNYFKKYDSLLENGGRLEIGYIINKYGFKIETAEIVM